MPQAVKVTVALGVKLIVVVRVLVRLIAGVKFTGGDAKVLETAWGRTERIAAGIAAVEVVLAELETGD